MLHHITNCLGFLHFGSPIVWKPFNLVHHATNFGDFNNCVSGDKKFLIRHVISKDHVLKGFCDFIGGRPA